MTYFTYLNVSEVKIPPVLVVPFWASIAAISIPNM